MKNITLSMLAAVAIGTITIGGASAMPFSANNGSAALGEGLVQDIRVVCNRNGQCWNTGRYRSTRRVYSRGYYERPGYYAEPGYGYYGGPRVGVGIGPFGFGLY
ncbi:MAG: hypothetical protein QOF91_3548 [Alphaproteobacteria bacterium]|jgi:hypothetical protein|nr:hypothetical protein [Alphaproteobacteria bacterium]MEA3028263.1 hypothetical protein [Alphaproteobacteria bacterium]